MEELKKLVIDKLTEILKKKSLEDNDFRLLMELNNLLLNLKSS